MRKFLRSFAKGPVQQCRSAFVRVDFLRRTTVPATTTGSPSITCTSSFRPAGARRGGDRPAVLKGTGCGLRGSGLVDRQLQALRDRRWRTAHWLRFVATGSGPEFVQLRYELSVGKQKTRVSLAIVGGQLQPFGEPRIEFGTGYSEVTTQRSRVDFPGGQCLPRRRFNRHRSHSSIDVRFAPTSGGNADVAGRSE